MALKVWGKTINELFLNAALGTIEAMGPTAKGRGTQKTTNIKIATAGQEELCVRWLNEIVFLIQNKRFLPKKWQLLIAPNGSTLKAKMVGKIYKELALTREVKSATYHDLKIKKTRYGFLTTVILDV